MGRPVFLRSTFERAMPDPTKTSATNRIPRAFPRWGFFKGLLTGAVIEAPALASGVWLLGRLGAGDPDGSYMRILRLTVVFAGAAAVMTAAGIGRLAAHASLGSGGRRRAVLVAARAHAVAGCALLLIAMLPHGHLPNHVGPWLWVPVIGAGLGAACGAMIGLVCGGAAPVGIGDVMALARTPGHALRQLLSPDDLLKLGAAVRQRTSRMFDGMFEPARPPPSEAKPEPPVPAPKDPPRD